MLHLIVSNSLIAATEVLLNLVTPKSGERVLDVACGTGVVARAAREVVGPGGRAQGADGCDGGGGGGSERAARQRR